MMGKPLLCSAYEPTSSKSDPWKLKPKLVRGFPGINVAALSILNAADLDLSDHSSNLGDVMKDVQKSFLANLPSGSDEPTIKPTDNHSMDAFSDLLPMSNIITFSSNRASCSDDGVDEHSSAAPLKLASVSHSLVAETESHDACLGSHKFCVPATNTLSFTDILLMEIELLATTHAPPVAQGGSPQPHIFSTSKLVENELPRNSQLLCPAGQGCSSPIPKVDYELFQSHAPSTSECSLLHSPHSLW